MGWEDFGYQGKRALVIGAASGIGAATAALVESLGASLVLADVKPITDYGSAQCLTVDLRDPDSIAAMLDGLDAPVDALFLTAGLPGDPFPMADVMLVNFVGQRHVIEEAVRRGLVPQGGAIAVVSSLADMGWQDNLAVIKELLAIPDFESARQWVLDPSHAELVGDGYNFSKQTLSSYVRTRAASLNAQYGVRLNATSPGPTNTPLTRFFQAKSAASDLDFSVVFKDTTGHGPATPAEQAGPLAFLNSAAASFVSGTVTHVDSGYHGGMETGSFSFAMFDSKKEHAS